MTKEESAQRALVEATDMKFTTAYSKGWDDAVEKAVKYLYTNLIYVPEEDNPHVEGSKIENLDMFISDFKKNMLNE